MRCNMYYWAVFGVLVTILAATNARPQQFSRPNWNPNGNNGWNPDSNVNNPIQPTSTTPSSVPTTASPRFLACMQRCLTTMEYNPVCGDDSVNYHNEGRLRCANMCGKPVTLVRMGTCAPL